MHLHVLGAGSIGCLFAHHAARAGWPVTLLLRPRAAAAFDAAGRRVRVDGCAVECSAEEIKAPPFAAGGSGVGGRKEPLIENLLVTTQAPQTAAALASVAHRLSRESVIVLLQNGVLAVYEELLGGSGGSGGTSASTTGRSHPTTAAAAAALRSQRPQFLLGSTTHGATRRAPFDVAWHEGSAVFGRPLARVGDCDSSSGGNDGSISSSSVSDRRGEVLAALGSPALAPLRVDASLPASDLHAQLLRKLLVNAAANPLAALLRCRNGGLLASGAARELIAATVAECRAALGPPVVAGQDAAAAAAGDAAAAAAAAAGLLHGSQDELVDVVEAVLRATSGNVNSMLASVLRGSATEVDYINGCVGFLRDVKGVFLNNLSAHLIYTHDALPTLNPREQIPSYVVAQAAARGVATPLNTTFVKLLTAIAEVPAEMRER
jgi:2-dehydropantoate 2-reductase